MIEHTSDEAIAGLAPWWRKNARADFGPFGLPEWAEVYRRNFGAEAELLILEVQETPGQTDALIPLERHGDGALRFIGGSEVTDYAAPVTTDRGGALLATEFAGWLVANPGEWSSVSLEAMPVDIGFGDLIVEAARLVGLTAERSADEICAVIDLPPTFDAYLESLDKKERHEFRRKSRKFAREVGEPTLVKSEAATLESDLAEFFTWHRAASGDKGTFMDARMETFFTDVARTFIDLGLLRLEFVEAAGERWAASFGFSDQTRFYGYNAAYCQAARPYSPGMVMLWMLLGELLESGVTTLDFLQGDERYKFQLGSVARRLESVQLMG